ncbi:hypothetical protein MNEG_7143 [Monoraphidium neglectum]|uniref:Uncharacterized protein n=1 Tax=Monoraphidium neglectum TaxID=145388 RepID=A0A0D2MC57_9CHLO|nr:hypothetical protein MNEG_7143 [Monoraphidium neglectum]KIZ00820.1 hypothetical protein MNEG_7143 [Monoraphidium neglectum]|eukprot:XP_013899839.1 hypothetical protein MNEG_7143 [Monoraphidium neglectum]
MQGLRRLASVALQQGTRSFGYTSQASQLAAPKAHSSGKADKIGLLISLPLCAAFIIYDIVYPEDEFEGKIPWYPYMRIRTRSSYPWGNDTGPFENHRYVGGGDEH